jgi:hypothetical protein
MSEATTAPALGASVSPTRPGARPCGPGPGTAGALRHRAVSRKRASAGRACARGQGLVRGLAAARGGPQPGSFRGRSARVGSTVAARGGRTRWPYGGEHPCVRRNRRICLA